MRKLFAPLRPFIFFEILVVSILTLCVELFKVETSVFMYTIRWPVTCNVGGQCTATGEVIRVVDFSEHYFLVTLGLAYIGFTLMELIVWSEMYSDAFSMVRLVFVLGITFAYVAYILGVNEILVFYMFIIYSFVLSVMMNVHDSLIHIGRGTSNLRKFSLSIDVYLMQGISIIIFRFVIRAIDSGSLEVYPTTVLVVWIFYAWLSRYIRYVHHYRYLPKEAIAILGANNVTPSNIYNYPYYLIVLTANPDRIIRFHFNLRLLDLCLVSFLMLSYVAQLRDQVDTFDI